MLLFQIVLPVFGVLVGFAIARRLRRIPGLEGERERGRGVFAFTAGALTWAAFAFIVFPAWMASTFLLTVTAIYLPPIMTILNGRTAPSPSPSGRPGAGGAEGFGG